MSIFSAFEQHVDRPCAAVARLRRAECGDFLPACQPAIDAGFQNRSFWPGAVTFAVDDTHAFEPGRAGRLDESMQLGMGLVCRQAVQVNFFLNGVIAAA